MNPNLTPSFEQILFGSFLQTFWKIHAGEKPMVKRIRIKNAERKDGRVKGTLEKCMMVFTLNDGFKIQVVFYPLSLSKVLNERGHPTEEGRLILSRVKRELDSLI